MEVFFGKSILRPNEIQKISIERIYKGIKTPKQRFKDQIAQLRTIAAIDNKQYAQLKKQLPYFVCGIFNPAIRKTEHFAAIEFFIIDLDHLLENEIDKMALLADLAKDDRIVMAFSSPGGDGLKVMFRLHEKCTDAALYSSFYKVFLIRFAHQYGLDSVIDKSTSDVTRACFMSVDAHAFFNPNARPILLAEYVNPFDFEESEKEIKQADRMIKDIQKEKNPTTIDKDVFAKIRNKLNPKAKKRIKKEVFVPPQITPALDRLREKLSAYNLQIVTERSIHYGKQLRIGVDLFWCEINLFYGKKGYHIVKTTKSGTNAELADLAKQVIEEVLLDFESPEEQ